MADRRREPSAVRPPSPPISAGRDRAAEALRSFAAVTAAAVPPEERAWRAVEQRLETGGARARLRALAPLRGWTVLAFSAAAIALLVGRAWRSADLAAPRAPATIAAAPVPAEASTDPRVVDDRPTLPRRASTPPPARTVALGAVARPLSVGGTELAGEAVVTLARAGSAAARSEPSRTVVRLDRGSATFDVAPGRGGRAFRVEAGAYAFEVLGTVFEVARDHGAVSLRVREGRVAVLRGGHRLAVVAAGGRWSARAKLRTNPAPVANDVDPMYRCADDVAVGDTSGAIKCYEAIAAQPVPASEASLVMAARLRAESGDADGAVALLRTHADRYPDGELDDEVKLLLIELLPTVGWDKEALALSGSYLASEAGQQHRSEILVLRGHIYRRTGACASALGEYRAAAEGARSPASDEGAFFHALCLQAVGRLADARRAYWEYLLRPGAARAAEARRRVDHME